MNTQLTFKNHSFNVIEKDNQVWISSVDLSKMLGYARVDEVSRIYRRNKDEFSPSMSVNAKMVFTNKNNNIGYKTVRLFSLRGAHLVAMFAKTEIAKDFRRWALDILDEEIKKPITTNKSLSKAQQEAEAIALLDKESFAKASKGAKDMNARKRAIKEVKARVIEWENRYQIKLDMPMPSGLLN